MEIIPRAGNLDFLQTAGPRAICRKQGDVATTMAILYATHVAQDESLETHPISNGAWSSTLDGSDLNKVAKAYANLRTALSGEIDIAMHCTGQFDTMSSVRLCRAIGPISPMWIEDPLHVNYSEAWLALKRSTRVPLLAGEKIEMARGFRPFLDNQALDIIHPDVAYSGGITGCKKIADYAAR